METLGKVQWGYFRIGQLFKITRPIARNSGEYLLGDIPFVASGANNNGVSKYFQAKKEEVLDNGNCLTISPVDGSTFFQPVNFLGRGGAGSSIFILRRENIQKYEYLFMQKTIQHTCSKYIYGHMGNKDSIKREQILLPIIESGVPDFDYMGQYTFDVQKRLIERYKQYIKKRIQEIEYREIATLSEKMWKRFVFSDIFIICKGFYNKKPLASGTGKIPFLGAIESNNGITQFLSYEEIDTNSKTGDLPNADIHKKIFSGKAIAVTNNGSVGHAYYQSISFTCSHDINPLYLQNRELNCYLAMFLIKTIEMQGILFQFARKWRPIRMVKSQILLPITESGDPDFDYMEQYSKNMMLGNRDFRHLVSGRS